MPDIQLIPITDRLFIRGHTRWLATERVLRLLQGHGVRMVVCVAKQKDETLERAAGMIGMRYHHAPLQDGQHVPRARVVEIASIVAQGMQDGGVLVHCDGGRNRSVLVAGFALQALTGLTGTPLVEHLRQARPIGLTNKAFEQMLLGVVPATVGDPSLFDLEGNHAPTASG